MSWQKKDLQKARCGNELDLQTTLNRHVKNLNRKIEGYDKQIAYHKAAIGKIQPERTANPNVPNRGQGYVPSNKSSQLPAEQPKWYQFGKRIRNWWNSITREDDTQTQSGTQTQTGNQNNANNSFRDSMKYEVVQDVLDEQDVLKQMEEERKLKNAKKDDKDDYSKY